VRLDAPGIPVAADFLVEGERGCERTRDLTVRDGFFAGTRIRLPELGQLVTRNPDSLGEIERIAEPANGLPLLPKPQRTLAGGLRPPEALALGGRARAVSDPELVEIAQRVAVVRRQQLRDLLPPLSCLAFRPVRNVKVLLGAQRLRQRFVGDVPDEDVPERELVLAREGRWLARQHKLLDAQPPYRVARLARAAPGEAGNGAQPERPPDHGGILEDRLLDGRKRVEAGSDERLDRARNLDLDGSLFDHPPLRPRRPKDLAVDQHANDLLAEERIPLAPLDDGAPELVR
jgi:hypothetical protein